MHNPLFKHLQAAIHSMAEMWIVGNGQAVSQGSSGLDNSICSYLGLSANDRQREDDGLRVVLNFAHNGVLDGAHLRAQYCIHQSMPG
eukprot:1159198-Pelagomonas_calceolata.AAC.6